MPLRLFVVDDSPFVRDILRTALSRFPDVEIVGEASNGKQAADLVATVNPDIITMDIVMPLMGGIDAIREIMAKRPTPIVVVADARNQDRLAMDAMGAGAAAVFPKPAHGFDDANVAELVTLLRDTAQLNPRQLARSIGATAPRTSANLAAVSAVGIVSSTGGPQTLRTVLAEGCAVPVLIVQHTSKGFSRAFADWLDDNCPLEVRTAGEGEVLTPGTCLVAPDDQHLAIRSDWTVKLTSEPPRNGVRPSGDVLFESLARSFGQRALGIVLTGMGRDGTKGLRAIDQAGGACFVEDPNTAILHGMPSSAAHALPAAPQLSAASLCPLLSEKVGRTGRR